MDCCKTRELMSDYLEQCLPEPETCDMGDHLSSCAECRAELEDLSETLRMIRVLPRQEPGIDLWQEFAPTFAQVRAEMTPAHLMEDQPYFRRLFGAIREGWTVFITVIRYNTRTKVQRPA